MLFAVTGGTGFIGTVLVRRLSRDGHRVRVLARGTSDTARIASLPQVEIVRGDLGDLAALRRLCATADGLFHLAADLSYWRGAREEQDRVNVEGTRLVMRAAASAGTRRVVFTSSVAAVGLPAHPGVPAGEENPFTERSMRFNYLWSKRRAEDEAFAAMTRDGLDVVSVNPSSVFGGEAGPGRQGGSQRFVSAVEHGIGRRVYPPGGTSVADVDAVVDAHLAAFEKGRRGQRYILAGHNVTYRDLFAAIAGELGVRGPRFGIPRVAMFARALVDELRSSFTRRPPEVSLDYAALGSTLLWYDSSKAERELGYRVAPFEECVRRAVASHRAAAPRVAEKEAA